MASFTIGDGAVMDREEFNAHMAQLRSVHTSSSSVTDQNPNDPTLIKVELAEGAFIEEYDNPHKYFGTYVVVNLSTFIIIGSVNSYVNRKEIALPLLHPKKLFSLPRKRLIGPKIAPDPDHKKRLILSQYEQYELFKLCRQLMADGFNNFFSFMFQNSQYGVKFCVATAKGWANGRWQLSTMTNSPAGLRYYILYVFTQKVDKENALPTKPQPYIGGSEVVKNELVPSLDVFFSFGNELSGRVLPGPASCRNLLYPLPYTKGPKYTAKFFQNEDNMRGEIIIMGMIARDMSKAVNPEQKPNHVFEISLPSNVIQHPSSCAMQHGSLTAAIHAFHILCPSF